MKCNLSPSLLLAVSNMGHKKPSLLDCISNKS